MYFYCHDAKLSDELSGIFFFPFFVSYIFSLFWSLTVVYILLFFIFSLSYSTFASDFSLHPLLSLIPLLSLPFFSPFYFSFPFCSLSFHTAHFSFLSPFYFNYLFFSLSFLCAAFSLSSSFYLSFPFLSHSFHCSPFFIPLPSTSSFLFCSLSFHCFHFLPLFYSLAFLFGLFHSTVFPFYLSLMS